MKRKKIISELLRNAWNERRHERYDHVLSLLEKAEELCKPNDHVFHGRIHHIKRQIEVDHGRYEDALLHNERAIESYTASGNSDRIAHSIRHLGDLYLRLNKLTEAESNYERAVSLYSDSQDTNPNDLANCLRGYALLLEKLNKNDKAVSIWKSTGQLYQICGLSDGQQEAEARIKALTDIQNSQNN